jgi:hypothetical protein
MVVQVYRGGLRRGAHGTVLLWGMVEARAGVGGEVIASHKKICFLFGTPHKWNRSSCYNLGYLAMS